MKTLIVLKNKTQEAVLLQHLKLRGSISGVEAQAIFKVRSLTRRITTLRNMGYDIKSEWNTDITGQRYVRYYLRKVNPIREVFGRVA